MAASRSANSFQGCPVCPLSMTMTMISCSVGSLSVRTALTYPECQSARALAQPLVGDMFASRRKNMSGASLERLGMEWDEKKRFSRKGVLLGHKKWCCGVRCGEFLFVLCGAVRCGAVRCGAVRCCVVSCRVASRRDVSFVMFRTIVVLLVVCLLCGEKKRCHVYDGSPLRFNIM